MGILEQVTQMKNQGISDEEIVSNLQQQGISPREIDDAISQSNIKNAVTNAGPGMEQSMMEPPTPGSPSPTVQGQYYPQTQEMGGEAYGTPQTGYDTTGYYAQPAGDYSTGGSDTETMVEVASQVFAEKIQKVEKKTDAVHEFKTLAEVKINNMEDRLKRIEAIIDRIQIDVLEKVGEFGRGLSTAKKEMTMMQDSIRKIAGKKHSTHKKSSKK